jgi:alpha-N-acetylglucosamine transferase
LDVLAERGIPTLHIPTLIPVTSYFVAESRFNEIWSKINIYRLDQFERIAVLDGDMLVLKNMDELMDIPIPDDGLAACHACVCNPRRLSHYPSSWYTHCFHVNERVPEACAYTYQSYPTSVKEGMSLSFPQGLSELNGGLQLFKPSRAKYERIYEVFNTSAAEDLLFADQSLLSKTFHGEWTPLCDPFRHQLI